MDLVDRQLGVKIHPHAARTRASETSGGVAVVLAGGDEIWRAYGEEGVAYSEPSGRHDDFLGQHEVGAACREDGSGRIELQVG